MVGCSSLLWAGDGEVVEVDGATGNRGVAADANAGTFQYHLAGFLIFGNAELHWAGGRCSGTVIADGVPKYISASLHYTLAEASSDTACASEEEVY